MSWRGLRADENQLVDDFGDNRGYRDNQTRQKRRKTNLGKLDDNIGRRPNEKDRCDDFTRRTRAGR